MALEGSAKTFAWILKRELKQHGIDSDKFEDGKMDKESRGNFETALKKSIAGHNPKSSEQTTKNTVTIAEKNLIKIDALCNNCYAYENTKTSYAALRRNTSGHPTGFIIAGKPLSDEAKKLAAEIYLCVLLKDFSISDTAVPAAVYCAANLCKEWRSASHVAFACMVSGQRGVATETILNAIRGNNGYSSIFKLLPELKAVLLPFMKEVKRRGNLQGAKHRWK